MTTNHVNLVGKRFGWWVVIARAPSRKASRSSRWLCRCRCGTERVVWANHLPNGQSRSCGCRRGEAHGDSTPPTPEYTAWARMWTYCTNKKHPRYKDWGGRGIRVCARWQSYTAFLADMGRRPSPHHSLDRKDNDGDYTPKNCRWATRKQQANNKRTSKRS